jgi:hypothetical protein
MAHANCTRCGNGVCYAHHNNHEHSSAWFWRDWGQGETLEAAAYLRGYWSASGERFICKDCRGADGRRHSTATLVQSREWPQDPFRFALSAASLGYVITQPGITYAQTVQAWASLGWQPIEEVTVPRLVRPEKRKRVRRGVYEVTRPAQFVDDKYHGWVFPRTIRVNTGQVTRQEDEVWSWSGSTDILTDGRVLHLGKFAVQPYNGATHRLIVEMARKMSITRGIEWRGPAESWDT